MNILFLTILLFLSKKSVKLFKNKINYTFLYRNNLIYSSLEGRRIVDINYVFEQIQSIRHEKFDCSFLDMVFLSEYRKGYSSVFKFKCKMCNYESTIHTEKIIQTNSLGINKAIVNGSLAIGNLFI